MIRAVAEPKTAVFPTILTHPGLLASTAALLVYLLTLAPDLTWRSYGGDGGELIAASVTLGVPHPTGYPTYVLLGKLFSLLPIGTIAYRFNLFSAVAVAAAVGLTAVSLHTRFSRSISLAASLTLAFTPLVWSQATITEVYGLNLLAVAAVVWAVMAKRPLFQTTLLFALALTTHATSLLLLPLFAWATIRKPNAENAKTEKTSRPLRFKPRLCIKPHSAPSHIFLGLLLGLTPLLALPWLARSASPIVWGQPDTLSGWWWLVSGQLYRANLFAQTLPELAQRLADWSRLVAVQFSWLGLPLIAWGCLKIGRGQTQVNADQSTKSLLLSLLLTAVLYLLYALNYATPDAHILLLPALLLFTFPLAAAFELLPSRADSFGKAVSAILFGLPILLLATSLTQPPAEPIPLRPAVADLFTRAPANAVLLTPGDATIFTLWYFHHAEKQRPDLMLVDANLLAFDWYRQRLAAHYPRLRQLTHDDLAAFQQANRPLCMVALHPTTISCHEDS